METIGKPYKPYAESSAVGFEVNPNVSPAAEIPPKAFLYPTNQTYFFGVEAHKPKTLAYFF